LTNAEKAVAGAGRLFVQRESPLLNSSEGIDARPPSKPGAHEHVVVLAPRDEKTLSAEPKDRPKDEDTMQSNGVP
jgi:hypothetical protein